MLHSLPLPLACVQVEDIVLFAISKAHSGKDLGRKFSDKLTEATCCSRVLLRPAPNAVNLWQAVGFQLATLHPAEQSKLESKNVPFCRDCKWMERCRYCLSPPLVCRLIKFAASFSLPLLMGVDTHRLQQG